MTREHGRLALRLAVAPHRAIGNDPLVPEKGDRGIKRVEWTAAGRQHVQSLWIEREARAAVLHDDAGGRQHAAGAELPIKGLDVRDDETVRIRRTHPDCIAVA